MVDVDRAVIARLKIEGKIFEILVDCDAALEFKEGKTKVDNALATKNIYSDVKKGLLASEYDIKKLFKTNDPYIISERIIKDGEIQLTAEHRNKIREEKKRKIINIIQRNAINPQNNLPHPADRIERAMQEAKVHIDEFKKAEDQVQNVVSRIKTILPIRFENRKLSVTVPAKYTAQSYGILKQIAELKKEQWQNDGSLTVNIEIPAGMQEEVEDKLNKLTHGEVIINIIK